MFEAKYLWKFLYYAIQNAFNIIQIFKSFSLVHYVLDYCIETYRIILPRTWININKR